MSGFNMLEQVATCPAATCSNKQQHVQLQHAQTGCKIMLHCGTTTHFYCLLDVILVALLKM
jgi:hypothetical protein